MKKKITNIAVAGNQGNNKIIWGQWQIDFLKENFASMTAQQLSNALGIKRTKVREMYYRLGLKKQEMEYWTEEQVLFLKKNYKKYGDTDLAEMFAKKWSKNKGWTKKHIEKKRRYLGLKRTIEEREFIKIQNTKNGRFAICPIKAWLTRGGAAPEGEIRYWGKIPVIKIKGVWVHWARHTWILNFGRIKAGYVVVFKVENTKELKIENLELITRKEHAFRNKTKFHELPSDLKKDIKALNKLKKHIRYAKQND